ncbi:hypothetical protein [Sphingopyxis terrae]|uniref:hypothetical protein n=1 Tax=Sphingopyxis terrae TaxID=33052 RepID=UPI0019344AE0|nr:hypothetical protein [Sphingopyxis terrae]
MQRDDQAIEAMRGCIEMGVLQKGSRVEILARRNPRNAFEEKAVAMSSRREALAESGAPNAHLRPCRGNQLRVGISRTVRFEIFDDPRCMMDLPQRDNRDDARKLLFLRHRPADAGHIVVDLDMCSINNVQLLSPDRSFSIRFCGAMTFTLRI